MTEDKITDGYERILNKSLGELQLEICRLLIGEKPKEKKEDAV
jgi:hypothetical protein